MSEKEKVKNGELEQVSGGIPQGWNGVRYCYNCGAEYHVTWPESDQICRTHGMCSKCRGGSALKRGFRHLMHQMGYKY